MSATSANATATYSDQQDVVRVGTKYSAVETTDRAIRQGDIVLVEDTLDRGDIENGVEARVFVGVVESVLDPEYSEEPALFTTAECGRVPVSRAEVSGEGSRVSPQSGLAKFVDQFLNHDEVEEWMTLEWVNGTLERTGDSK